MTKQRFNVRICDESMYPAFNCHSKCFRILARLSAAIFWAQLQVMPLKSIEHFEKFQLPRDMASEFVRKLDIQDYPSLKDSHSVCHLNGKMPVAHSVHSQFLDRPK